MNLRGGSYKHLGFCLLSCSFFIGFFHRFAPATFSFEISSSLNITASAVGALASTHFWVYTFMQVPAGILVDRYGIRINAFVGTLLTGVGSVVLSISGNIYYALIGPALVGLGMSTVFVSVMKYNSNSFPSNKYGLVTGITMLLGVSGSVISGAPSSYLLHYFNWRQIFFSLGLLTIALSVFIIFFTSHVGNKPSNVDDFSVRENLKSILKSKQIFFVLLCVSGTNGTFYAFAGLWGAPILVDGFSLSSSNALFLVTSSLVVYGLGSLVVGALSDYFSMRKIFLVIPSFIGVISWLALIFLKWSPYYGGVIIYLLLGISASQVVVAFSTVKESVADSLSGTSIAFVNTGVFLTSAILQLLTGVIIEAVSSNVDSSFHYDIADYKAGFILSLVFGVVGFLSSLSVKETRVARI